MSATVGETTSKPLASPGLGFDPTPQQEFALFARMLHRIGYDDGLAGHITYLQPDGTLLVNPFSIPWDQMRASYVARTDVDGNHLEGPYSINPATTLHFELHRARKVGVAVHNHPRWTTTWAAHKRIPPCYDQTSALFSGEMVVVEEYGGTVEAVDAARAVVKAMGAGEIALLANHGVLLTADGIEQALTRAMGIEVRSRNAWQVEALGGSAVPLDASVEQALSRGIHERAGGAFPNLFEALVLREVDRDARVLD